MQLERSTQTSGREWERRPGFWRWPWSTEQETRMGTRTPAGSSTTTSADRFPSSASTVLPVGLELALASDSRAMGQEIVQVCVK